MALVIGAIAAYLAWRQYRVARAKLKLELFDKRYKIFLRTWTILSNTALERPGRNYGLGTPFNNFVPRAAFLFGTEIEKYLSQAETKWSRLRGLDVLAGQNKLDAPKQTEEREKLREWFMAQANVESKTKFAEYLDFSKWK